MAAMSFSELWNRESKDDLEESEDDWIQAHGKIGFTFPQCHLINKGKDIAIIGATGDPFIYVIQNRGGIRNTKRYNRWKYPFTPNGHTVVKMKEHPDHSEFISFGGSKDHFYRISLYPKKVEREDLFPSVKDELPFFYWHPQGIFVNEHGWSDLIVTGGDQHLQSISMIHFPSHKVTRFKDILPADFDNHAMIPLSSQISSNTVGFILIRDRTTLECVYKKDEKKWSFKKLRPPPRVKDTFFAAAWEVVHDKWIIGVGGNVGHMQPSQRIRCYNILRNEWIVCPIELPKGLKSMGTCIVGGDLHVIGGYSHRVIPLSSILGDEWRPRTIKPIIPTGDKPMRIKNPLVICICIESYPRLPRDDQLTGATKDKSIMINLFTDTKVCGYSKSNVIENKHKTVTTADWESFLLDAKQRIWKDDSAFDSLIFYYAGHGLTNGRLWLSDGNVATIRDLQSRFDGQSCEKLRGCPKIMVFACCRGGKGLADRVDNPRFRGPTESRWENATGNFLSVFPTAETFQVFDSDNGSYIARAFDTVLKKNDLKSVHFQDLWMKISRVHEKSSGFLERMNIHSSIHRHVYLKE